MGTMAKANASGRHDAAIKVGQDWISKHPGDSHCWIFYGQIAINCLMKASKDNAHKDEWIREAVSYYEKDLAAHTKGSVDVELYDVGRGFEYAGDLSARDACLYYKRAVKYFEDEIPFIQGESYTAYGSTTPLAPVRVENQKTLDSVKSRIDKAGCK